MIFVQALLLLIAVLYPATILAQTPDAPAPDPGTWVGSAGGGLALTSGNSDTLTFNVSADVTRDPGSGNVMKWTVLFIRGQQDEVLVSNRLSMSFRDQYALSPRSFVFGQIEYLRDTFKLIEHLVAPTAGVGYKLVESAATKMAVDVSAGAVGEKSRDLETHTSMALTAGEELEHHLTETSTIKHVARGLWKADDFGDALLTTSIALATKISEQLQLSVELLDTFKNRPAAPAVKNDVALVTAITAKF